MFEHSIVLSVGAALKKLRKLSAAIDGLRLLAPLILKTGREGKQVGKQVGMDDIVVIHRTSPNLIKLSDKFPVDLCKN